MLFRKRDRERENFLHAINQRLYHIEALLTAMVDQNGFHVKNPKRQEAARRAQITRRTRELAREAANGALGKSVQD